MVIQLSWKKVEKVAVGEATIINAAVAISNGEWIDVEGIGDWSIDVSGIAGGSIVRAHGSNKLTAPASGEAERQLGSDITADGIRQYDAPIKWFKASLPTYGSGTVTVSFKMRNRG